MILRAKELTLVAIEDVVTVSPNARRTFASFATPLVANATVVLDSSNVIVGDELVLSLKSDGVNVYTITFGEGFLFTHCGGVSEGGNTMEIGTDDRWIGHFWYNGTTFVDTSDNC